MTAPVPNLSRSVQTPENSSDRTSHAPGKPELKERTATVLTLAKAGWDPFEVWRTRIFGKSAKR